MVRQEQIDVILKLRSENGPTKFFNLLKSEKYRQIYDAVMNYTDKLTGFDYAFRTRLYWFLHGLTDFPACAVCGKKLDRRDVCNLDSGYPSTCSRKCAYANERRSAAISKKHAERTEEEKAETRRKTENTCLEKYGVKHSMQSENNRRKTLETLKRKYGEGVTSSMQAESVRKKMRRNNLEKYGVENVYQAGWCKKKIADACMERYGASHAMQNAEVKAKAVARMTELSHIRSWERCILGSAYDRPNFDMRFYLDNYSRGYEFEFVCKKCGNLFRSQHYDGFHDKCPKCYPRTASVSEREIGDFVKSIYSGNVVFNTKRIISPNELDIYMPDLKLAIEYDGLYWHAFENVNKSHGNKNYHLDKTNACEEKGVRLIHIFEDEWRNKREIVESRLRTIIGACSRRIFARRCEVVELDSKTAGKLVSDWHLQGDCRASVRLGLSFENEIVSVMTFGKCRFGKKHEWELLRFCVKPDVQVVGGAGKLLKHFERAARPKSMVTYADRRWSNGRLYEALGFKLAGVSKPGYFYVQPNHVKRLNRIGFQKHRLEKILKKFDKNLTEYQNMAANGYETIYDCGNYVFEKTY